MGVLGRRGDSDDPGARRPIRGIERPSKGRTEARVCGWHRKRSDGAAVPAVLLGALLGLTLPLLGVGGSVRAADGESDEEPADDESTDEESTSKEIETSVDVLGRRDAASEARDRPESAFARDIDASVPPTTAVSDVLQDVPGATVRRTGGPLSPAYVSVRGSSSQQVAVFVDGVPLNSFGAAAVDLSQLPLRAFDRVELYRGYAPAHLGGFAIGGAVDLITDPRVVPTPRVEVGVGSFLTRRVAVSAGRRLSFPLGVAQVRAHVAYDGTRGDYPTFSNRGTFYDDSDDVTRRRANNHRDQVSGLLHLSADLGRWKLRLLDAPVWSDGGVAGTYDAETQEASSRTVQNLVHGRVEWRAARGVTLHSGVGWRVRSERYQDLLGEVGVGTQDLRNQRHSIDGDLSVALEPTRWLTLRPSIRNQVLLFRALDFVGEGDRGPMQRRMALQGALDAGVRLVGERLRLRASLGVLAVEDRSVDAPVATLLDVLPGVAIVGQPTPWLTAHASFARAVRPPTFLELFGDRGAVVGNPSLRPERGTQVDGGLRIQAAGASVRGAVEVGGWLREVQDLIVLVPNSARVAVPQNLGRVRLAGVETWGELFLGGMFEGRVGLTLTPGNTIVDGTDGTVGNRTPHVPLWQAHGSLAFALDPWLRVEWRFTGTGGTFDSPSNFFGQAARPLHDVFLRLQPFRKGPWLAVDVRNLFDTFIGTAYRNPLRPEPDDVVRVNLQDFRGQPLPGRSVMLTLGWSPGAS